MDQIYLMHDRFRWKTTETLGNIDCNSSKRRSEPTARSRPESRRLHPVGALARPHRKEVAPSAIIYTDKEEDPPDDSPSHPEARRLLSGEYTPGRVKQRE